MLNHMTFGRFTHAVFCLHYLLPYVGNIGTNGITTNGTIGKMSTIGKNVTSGKSSERTHNVFIFESLIIINVCIHWRTVWKTGICAKYIILQNIDITVIIIIIIIMMLLLR